MNAVDESYLTSINRHPAVLTAHIRWCALDQETSPQTKHGGLEIDFFKSIFSFKYSSEFAA